MTEKHNTRNFITLIVSAILSFVAAIGVFAYINLYHTADNLFDQGDVFGEKVMKDNNYTTVQITGFLPKRVATIEEQAELYLIEFSQKNKDKYGYAGLEVKKDDKIIDELKAKQKDLYDHPVKVLAKIRQSGSNGAIENYSSNFKDFLEEFDASYLDLAETRFYVSSFDAQQDAFIGTLIAAGLGLLGIIFLVSAYFARKAVGKAYGELYASYPELNHSVDTLLDDATYCDKALGIILYKNHLITTYKNFQVYDLTKAERIYHYIYTQKSYGITVNRTSQLIVLSKDKTYRKHKTSLLIKNVGADTDDLLQPFFFAISQEFPDVHIGYEEKNKRPF